MSEALVSVSASVSTAAMATATATATAAEAILRSRAPVVFNASLVLTIVATVFVVLRLSSKWIVVKRNNSDDVFTIIAWVSDPQGGRGVVGR
jgi:hypothetical protein